MKYFWARCDECSFEWLQACWLEHGYVVPESEDCPECKGAITVDVDAEYSPSEARTVGRGE